MITRRLASILLALFISTVVSAQEITSVQHYSGSGSEFANGVHVDGDGNYYLTGYFSGALSFAGTTLNGVGSGDIFFVKFDPNGTLQWARTGTSSGWNGGRGIAVDPDGNAFVVGRVQGTASFDGRSVTSAGQNDPFIAKYSSSGQVAWVRSGRGAGDDWAQDVAAGPEGRSYVTGKYSGSISFGATTLTSAGAEDAFLVGYDTDGSLLWSESIGGIGQDVGYGVAVDADGNVYVVGEFLGSMTIGGTTLSGGGRSGFVASWTADGAFRWAEAIQGTLVAEKVEYNRQGGIYVVGAFSGSASVGETTVTSAGAEDIYVARYDTAGVAEDVWRFGGSGTDGVAGFGQSSQVAATSDGGFVLVSSFERTVKIGETTLTSAGKSDLLVARLGPTGLPSWAVSGGGTDTESFMSVGVDGEDRARVFGNFFSSTFSFGSATFVRSGFADMFLATVKSLGEVAPKAGITPLLVDFGTVGIDSVASRSVTIRPATNAELSVTSIAFKDPATATDAGFRIVIPSTVSLPVTLAPGERIDILLEFESSEPGEREATLEVATTDGTTPLREVPVRARGVVPGVEPVIKLSQPEVDFGTLWVGQEEEASLTITAGSTAPLTIFEIDFLEDDAFNRGFEVIRPDSDELPLEVAPGESLRVDLLFVALADAEENLTLEIGSNDPAMPVASIPVIARGATAPIATFSTFALGFAEVETGASESRSITIGAGNRTPLQIEAIELIGENAGVFRIIAPADLSTLPLSIGEGSDLRITIACEPQTEGEFTAQLRVVTNDPTLLEGVVDLSASGTSTSGVAGESRAAAWSVRVDPNPLQQTGVVRVEGIEGGAVLIRVLDLLGRSVATLHEGRLAAGQSAIPLDRASLPKGSYLLEVVHGGGRLVTLFTVL